MGGGQSWGDGSLGEPLEDRGLLQVLEPKDWVDKQVTEELATVIVDLLAGGAFDELPTPAGGQFNELSYSRMGYGADVELSTMLVEELEAKGLARPSKDGVSVPLHPLVRTTILVVLGQLSRAAGERRGMAVHPATSDHRAMEDLLRTLAREPL